MAGFILIADPQEVARQQFFPGNKIRFLPGAFDPSHQQAGAGLTACIDGILRPLRQNIVVGCRPIFQVRTRGMDLRTLARTSTLKSWQEKYLFF